VRLPARRRPRRRAGRTAGRCPTPPYGHRLATVLAGAAVIIGGTGCGAGTPAPAGGAAAAPVPPLLRTVDLRLPLDDYLMALPDSVRLARAVRLVQAGCLRRLGFPAAVEPVPAVGPRSWNDRRYGLTDPAQAPHGYWPDSRTTPGSRPRSAAGDAEGAALTGSVRSVHGRPVPAGGCAGEASRRLLGHDPAGVDRELAQRLSYASFAASRRDPAVVAATAAWSACMAAAGHPYAGPLDPPADPRFQGAFTPLEAATATADIGCKRRTNLVGIWVAAEAATQRALIADHRPALELARTAVTAELAAAAAAGAR
jgi:hypothetical protein